MTGRVGLLLREKSRLLEFQPESHAVLKDGTLVWTGELRPTMLSPTYRVRITYSGRSAPAVRVLSPPLERDKQGHLPHVYQNGTLCLHLEKEWSQTDSLVNSVLPWTSEWLFFYEIWKATGQWTGSGGDHAGSVLNRRQRRMR